MTARFARIASLVALVVVTGAMPVYAQAVPWGTYDGGRRALREAKTLSGAAQVQKYKDAIAQFEKAIAINPTPAGHIKADMDYLDYFPQYYMFIAYLGLKDADKARQFFAQKGPVEGSDTAKDKDAPLEASEARLNKLEKDAENAAQFAIQIRQIDPLVRQADTAQAEAKAGDDQAKIADYVSKLEKLEQALLEVQKLAAATPELFTPHAPKLRDAQQRKTDAAGVLRSLALFNAEVAKFEAVRTSKQHTDDKVKVDHLTAASQARRDLFDKKGLQANLDAAKAAVAAYQDFLNHEATVARTLNAKQYDDALAECARIQTKYVIDYRASSLPTECAKAKAGADGLADYKGAVARARASLTRAAAELTGDAYDNAIREFTSAQTLNPTLFVQDKLPALLEDATKGKQVVGEFERAAAHADGLLKDKKFKDAANEYASIASNSKWTDFYRSRNLKDKADAAKAAMDAFETEVKKTEAPFQATQRYVDVVIGALDAADRIWPEEATRRNLGTKRKEVNDAWNLAKKALIATAACQEGVSDADAAATAGDFAKAIALLTSVMRDSPSCSGVGTKLAEVRRKWAVQDIDQALSSLKNEDADPARKLFLHAVDLESALDAPQKARLHGYLGVAYSYLKSDVDATREFKKALGFQARFDLESWVRPSTVKLFLTAKK